ncbi:MAG: acyl-CoA dehydrogenase family protein, partial [Rhodospirillales bacterium]|nr:acyl-CoA dehydrogenase family protein [Rhodospirillales bacterium]
MFELTETQKQLQETAQKVAARDIGPRAAEVDRSEQYPWNNVEVLKESGFFGMTIPEAYGGLGLSYLDAVLVIEEMAKVCGVTARIVVEANMGAIGAIMEYGSEAQKKLAAGLVLGGDKPAICITEPGAGSAASEMTTRADKKGDHYVLNGAKHWITGGGVSRLHLIFARVYEDGEAQGICGFIAVRDADQDTPKGLIIGKREPTMGLRGIPECEIIFEDLEIPADMAVVPPQGLKRGFAGLMTAYNAQRVGAATVALGIAQGAYELALAYSQEREQFGRPICEFQGLQWMLVDMDTQLNAARLLIYKAAAGAGDGFPDITEAARAKIFAAETAIKVTTDALQVFGASGYSRNMPLERMARDARMFTIGGGTAQVLRTMVASKILDR